jgi:DnaJ-class molecular chaperone
MKDLNYYQRLCLPQNATLQEIKSRYRKLAQIFHPDKTNGDKVAEENFKLIKEAYECLSNSNKRFEYDEKTFAKSASGIEQTASSATHAGNSTNSFWRNAAAFGVIALALDALFADASNPKRRLKPRKKITTRRYKNIRGK